MTTDPTSSPVTVRVRRGAYRDSVALMRVSRDVSAVDGVEAALVAMATELNLDLLERMGGTAPPGTGPDDLLIAVRAADDDALAAALSAVEDGLAARPAGTGADTGGGEIPPRGARSAAARAAATGVPATVALVSVPGRHAAAEAFDALEAGLDVLVFSDNVPVEHEVALKRAADRLDRLVMGPDCGTAVVGGAGLGFANAVRPGPVGIVAASGTGAQQVMCLLDAAGVGVSHCLGVGGRDLSDEVGGMSTRRALRLLDADPATERIVLVSKPPGPRTTDELRQFCADLGTPVHLALQGDTAADLTATTEETLRALGRPVPQWPHWPPEPTSAVAPPADTRTAPDTEPIAEAGALPDARSGPTASPGSHEPRMPGGDGVEGGSAPREGAPGDVPASGGWLRGLFCGGTLAEEAARVAGGVLGTVTVGTDTGAPGHRVVDLGDDRFTAGRPHPMIDPTVREELLTTELAAPTTAVVLLDVVLGHGAHPDPAAGVAARIRAARSRGPVPPVVASLCGTDADPQDLTAQATTLRQAGVEVFLSNAEAARRAAGLTAGKDTR